MFGRELERDTATALMVLVGVVLLVGILVGGGCVILFTSGCVPTVHLEWKADARQSSTE